jgi:hypothetical protein
MEPARERVVAPDRPGAPGEHQKHHLGGILSIVRVTQHVPADAEDHWRMTLDQDRKRGLVTLSDEEVEQASVGQGADRSHAEERAKVP